MNNTNLAEERIREFEGVFNYFGDLGETPICKKQIHLVMRNLGENPSDRELQEIMALIERDGNPPITFPYFLSLMAQKMQVRWVQGSGVGMTERNTGG